MQIDLAKQKFPAEFQVEASEAGGKKAKAKIAAKAKVAAKTKAAAHA